MAQGLEYWMGKVLTKEIRRTEMYFILELEKAFEIQPISAKRILNALMDNNF